MKFLIVFALLTVLSNSHAQIISQFTFDSNPVTTALVGPDASSISSSATSDVNGVGGTNGLNSGLPKLNINMIIPTDASFDVEGVDVSFDFQRDESSGTFFQRGSSLRINGIANLSVSYRVDDGAGGFNTVNSGNVYALPNDDTFRNYRFFYTECDGFGAVMVDGVVVWSNDGPDNRAMYWVGSGNITIGNGLDGNGANKTSLDNLIYAGIDCSALPIGLLSFNADKTNDERKVVVTWVTSSEQDNDYFTIEKSKDGGTWEEVEKVASYGNSTTRQEYHIIDNEPFSGTSYYRLTQTDFNGEAKVFTPVSVTNEELEEIKIYPNPVKSDREIVLLFPESVKGEVDIHLLDLKGREVKSQQSIVVKNESLFFSIPEGITPGVYVISAAGFQHKLLVE